jgi:hypothetical protein
MQFRFENSTLVKWMRNGYIGMYFLFGIVAAGFMVKSSFNKSYLSNPRPREIIKKNINSIFIQPL